MGSSHSDQIESDATNQFFSSSIRKIPNVQCCILIMLQVEDLCTIIYWTQSVQCRLWGRRLSVAWLWLNFTRRKREKPSSPIIICGSTSLGQRGEDFYSNLWMWYQSQFHSRRMCIQNHIYHLFQSIDNVFQYLYFYQYLLEAFHSEPNSLNYKIFFHSELAAGKCTTAIQFH